MKQASLKLKSYAGNMNAAADNGELRRRILHIMLWVFSALSLLYIFSLGNMVFNIVERRSLEAQARALSGEVGNLELQYLSASEKIDLNLAHSLGFKEIKAKFAARQSLGSLSIVPNEI